MAALGFLVLAIVCSLISRILLVKAAFGINWKWGIGVFMPFGPLAFRLSYPEEARSSRLFLLATLPCFFLYLMLSPGLISRTPKFGTPKVATTTAKPSDSNTSFVTTVLRQLHLASPPPPTPVPTPSIEMRLADNRKELERLKALGEELRQRKRDILKSDIAGARAYDRDADAYNAALAKANAEKLTLVSSIK